MRGAEHWEQTVFPLVMKVIARNLIKTNYLENNVGHIFKAGEDKNKEIRDFCKLGVELGESMQNYSAAFYFCNYGRELNEDFFASKVAAYIEWKGLYYTKDVGRAKNMYKKILKNSEDQEAQYYFALLLYVYPESSQEKIASWCRLGNLAKNGNALAQEYVGGMSAEKKENLTKCS